MPGTPRCGPCSKKRWRRLSARWPFIHRFGSSLNGHVHFHVCVGDRLLEEVELLNWTTLEQPLATDSFQPDAGIEENHGAFQGHWLLQTLM
jgi:hypothetical protein